MKHKLIYDPLLHRYTYNGRCLPSVTGIIQTVIPRQWNADEWCMQRGTMVHKALALHLADSLDDDSLDPRIVDRVQAGIMAIKAYAWQPAMIEPPMAHDIMLYAGMPDLITTCGALVDWKGSSQATTGIQLGAYSHLAQRNGIKIKKLYEVTTGEKGFKVKEYDLRRYMGLWVAVYGVYGFINEAH